MNKDSIYEMPHIKVLQIAEINAKDASTKQELHGLWLIAIKKEQIKRGQRTKFTYRNVSK